MNCGALFEYKKRGSQRQEFASNFPQLIDLVVIQLERDDFNGIVLFWLLH
jgi:hypothetical protein